jgi:hypothetical protein
MTKTRQCRPKSILPRAQEAYITSQREQSPCRFRLSAVFWEYFSGKAQQKGVDLSELVTDVLKRDIEISEALK